MPLYRFACSSCGQLVELLLALDEQPGASACCAAEQRPRMPTRVVGKVAEAAPAASPAAAQQRPSRTLAPGMTFTPDAKVGKFSPRAGYQPSPPPPPSELDIPRASFSGPPTSKADLDSRYLDTTQAMASWQARSLEKDGVPYHEALRRAERHQQKVSAEARAAAEKSA